MTDAEMKAALATAPELEKCANSWRPEVRLVGNVRADSIALICRALLALHAEVERLTKYVAHNDEEDLIARSSIGAGLQNIRDNGIEAELADLEDEMRGRR